MASALIATLVICSILSVFVLYYLSLIDQQSLLNMRSQVWNMAIAISEAGVEDGLQRLNSCDNYPNLSGDGWAWDGSCYSRSNSLPDGNAYTVQIYTTNSLNPVVQCQSYVMSIPRYACNDYNTAAAKTMFAAIAQGPAGGGSPFVSRKVQVTCSKANLFTAALAVKTTIDLNGNGVYTDSFDSTMPGFKSDLNGKYSSSIYSGDKGDIGTNGGLNNGDVSVQNANVYGCVHTGPNCPVSILPNGGVGPHGAQTHDINTAISLGYVKPDANFTFPDTSYPNTALFSTPSGGTTFVTSNYTSFATNSTWQSPTNMIGAATNWGTMTTVSYPASSPVQGSVATNYTRVTSVPWPGPGALNIATNSTIVTTPGAPVAGTYVGSVTVNKHGNTIDSYTYASITGYTYSVPGSYTYNGVTGYTVSLNNSVQVTNTYDYILWGGNKYVVSSIANKSICVKGANVILAIANGLDGSEKITWDVASGMLVYSGDSDGSHSVTVSGNQYLNPNGSAGSFVIYCPSSVTSITFNGNGQFTGVLIAPNANLAMNGGGNSNEDFCGSLMCNSIKFNGHFSFHYDEALKDYALNGRFLVKSWNEVKPSLASN